MCDVSQKENAIVFQIVVYVGGLQNEHIQSLRRIEISPITIPSLPAFGLNSID